MKRQYKLLNEDYINSFDDPIDSSDDELSDTLNSTINSALVESHYENALLDVKQILEDLKNGLHHALILSEKFLKEESYYSKYDFNDPDKNINADYNNFSADVLWLLRHYVEVNIPNYLDAINEEIDLFNEYKDCPFNIDLYEKVYSTNNYSKSLTTVCSANYAYRIGNRYPFIGTDSIKKSIFYKKEYQTYFPVSSFLSIFFNQICLDFFRFYDDDPIYRYLNDVFLDIDMNYHNINDTRWKQLLLALGSHQYTERRVIYGICDIYLKYIKKFKNVFLNNKDVFYIPIDFAKQYDSGFFRANSDIQRGLMFAQNMFILNDDYTDKDQKAIDALNIRTEDIKPDKLSFSHIHNEKGFSDKIKSICLIIINKHFDEFMKKYNNCFNYLFNRELKVNVSQRKRVIKDKDYQKFNDFNTIRAKTNESYIKSFDDSDDLEVDNIKDIINQVDFTKINLEDISKDLNEFIINFNNIPQYVKSPEVYDLTTIEKFDSFTGDKFYKEDLEDILTDFNSMLNTLNSMINDELTFLVNAKNSYEYKSANSEEIKKRMEKGLQVSYKRSYLKQYLDILSDNNLGCPDKTKLEIRINSLFNNVYFYFSRENFELCKLIEDTLVNVFNITCSWFNIDFKNELKKRSNQTNAKIVLITYSDYPFQKYESELITLHNITMCVLWKFTNFYNTWLYHYISEDIGKNEKEFLLNASTNHSKIEVALGVTYFRFLQLIEYLKNTMKDYLQKANKL